ncbi:hypothetical protein [Croceicoccus mobilis]|uniref:Uncharacterized protein n=1 Tax=Croceicoccus mobilis TaxID=1703339 RepID=A0A916Z344_9SPHN|nr:hypothetical protein [Croceicoccus mobilis]GGD73984.1 hypothetical protein GCM10010990_24500 [Croceicoccus mobilis]
MIAAHQREARRANRALKRIGPVADAFVASNAFIVGIMGPVGSGKTIASAQKMLQLAARQLGTVNEHGQIVRKARFAFIRDTYPNLDRNTIPSWFKVVPKHMGQWVGSSPRVHRFTMILRQDANGRAIDLVEVEVEFRAIGDQSVEDALRGLEVTAAFINEADRTSPEILQFLAGRVGRFGDIGVPQPVDPCIILDLNGADDDNWTYKVLVAEELGEGVTQALSDIMGGRELIAYFQQPEAVNDNGEVNPKAENLSNLPQGYYQRQYALAKARGDEQYIDRMLRSRFTPLRNGLSVFPEYVDKIHGGEFEAIPGLPLIVWADQGLVGGVLIAQPVKGQLRVLEEIAAVFESHDGDIVVNRMGGEALGTMTRNLLNQKYPDFELADAVCDPAGAQGEGAVNFRSWRQDFSKGLGHRVRKAKVPRNAIGPRLKAARARLNMPFGEERGLLIHKRCKMLRRAFMTKYYYARVRASSGDGHYTDQPVKVQGYGDLMDACQYGCFEYDRAPALSAGGQTRIGVATLPIQNDSDFDVLRGGF